VLTGFPRTGAQQPPASAELPPVMENTGLAVIKIDDITYEYTLDQQGRLVENQFRNSTWTIPENAVVATDASSNSPIAAVSYVINGQTSVHLPCSSDCTLYANQVAAPSLLCRCKWHNQNFKHNCLKPLVKFVQYPRGRYRRRQQFCSIGDIRYQAPRYWAQWNSCLLWFVMSELRQTYH
jgi:hypothetical protein